MVQLSQKPIYLDKQRHLNPRPVTDPYQNNKSLGSEVGPDGVILSRLLSRSSGTPEIVGEGSFVRRM